MQQFQNVHQTALILQGDNGSKRAGLNMPEKQSKEAWSVTLFPFFDPDIALSHTLSIALVVPKL